METYITTSIFRHRASIVGKRAALLWLSRRGWPIWIAIIVLLLLGMAVSPLFYIVGLMAAFLVFPTVMMLAYYHYMLSPEARKAILPQSIYFGNESFTVNYFSYDMDCDSEPFPYPDHSETSTYSNIKSIADTGNDIEITLHANPYLPLYVPISAFKSPEEASYINSYIKEHILRQRVLT